MAAKSHKGMVSSIAIYSTCSISMIVLNKLVVYTYKLNHPTGLLFIQNFGALLLVMMAKALGFVSYPAFSKDVAKKWLPLTVLFVLMLWTSIKSLHLMPVAVQTILKNLAIIFTAMGDSYFHGKVVTRMMYASFILMVIGSCLGVKGDKEVSAMGLFWTFANVAVTVSYTLYMKTLLGDVSKTIGRYGPVFYNNLLSLPFVAVGCASTFPDLLKDLGASSLEARLCLVLMVLAGSVMTFAVFWCMNETSPTTFSVTGALNKVPLAFISMFIFNQFPEPMGYVGIVVALGGGFMYTYANLPSSLPAPDPRLLNSVEEGRSTQAFNDGGSERKLHS